MRSVFHWFFAGYHVGVEGLDQVNQVIVGADNTDGKSNTGLVSTTDRGILIYFHSTGAIYTKDNYRPGSSNNGDNKTINIEGTSGPINSGDNNKENAKHKSKINERPHTAFEFRIKSNL